MITEQKARQKNDDLLKSAGWKIRDHKQLNPDAALGGAAHSTRI